MIGKRQVRPNLTRSEFGYERSRPISKTKAGTTTKAHTSAKREEDEDSAAASNGGPVTTGANGNGGPNGSINANAGGGGSANGGAEKGVRAEKDARNLTVDFTKLDMATLKRYKKHFRLKTRQNVTKTELAFSVAKHFASQTVDEADTISLFMYSARAGSLQYDRRDYLNGR
jgi:histone deacetylase complex subunit SAP30